MVIGQFVGFADVLATERKQLFAANILVEYDLHGAFASD
jgi:hypothetical protein